MFDFGWSEIALIGIVSLLFIGPKDMPVAIRTVTNMIKKGRKLAGEFQGHVDEMVREADLGEARDQLRQLRSFNVRGQVMRALDQDGSLKRTLDQPLVPPGAPGASGSLLPPPTVAVTLPPQAIEARPVQGMLAPDHSWVTADAAIPAATMSPLPDAPDPLAPDLLATDPAPSILPPRVARRLATERAQPHPPRILPPRPVHPNAVPPGRGSARV